MCINNLEIPGMLYLFSYRWRNYGWGNTILAHSTLFSRIFHRMVGLNESHIGFGPISFFGPSPLLSPLGFFGPFHNYKPRGYTRGVTVLLPTSYEKSSLSATKITEIHSHILKKDASFFSRVGTGVLHKNKKKTSPKFPIMLLKSRWRTWLEYFLIYTKFHQKVIITIYYIIHKE